MNVKAIQREAVAYAESLGATDCRIEHGGKHPCLIYRWRGRRRRHTLPSSPRGQRWWNNMQADLRRAMKR